MTEMIIPTIVEPLIPLWLKTAYSAYVAITLPVYYRKYGPANFLWFSDIALITTVAALWMESSTLASMMIIAILIPEFIWNIGFFSGLITGKPIWGLANYMFDKEKPLYLRSLSLFHIFLPPMLLWMIYRIGYDENALLLQSAVALVVLPICHLFTSREDNINWVFGVGTAAQQKTLPVPHLLLMMVAFPLLIYLPTHLLLMKLVG
ncbi:membrane-associated protein [Pseudomonadota bacterium]